MDADRKELEARLVHRIEHLVGTVERDEQQPGQPIVGVDLNYAVALELMVLNNLPHREAATDADLEDFDSLTKLRFLGLDYTIVSDTGLHVVGRLANIEQLNLDAAARQRPLVSDVGLKHLRGLKKLESLNLQNRAITDAGVRELAGLESLERLVLCGTAVTGATLHELAALPSLTSLFLDRSPLDDDGLKQLRALSSLECLSLGRTRVTFKGLTREVPHMTRLQYLNAVEFDFTDAEKRELKAALPGCRILTEYPRPGG